MDDAGLLQEYGSRKSETAFGELVARHVPLVFSAALRQLGNQAQAEDVTQVVFVILAQKASRLPKKTILAGWLYRTTRHVAAKAARSEQRRRKREQESLQMQTNEAESVWQQLAPFLDEAMAQLGEVDRGAVLLRYFQNKSLREVGNALGMSEDTAQKRVSRAIEKLRGLLLAQADFPGAALTGLLGTHGAQIAPRHLSATVAAAALSKAAVSAPVNALLQESIRRAIWPKTAAAATAAFAPAVAAAVMFYISAGRAPQSSSSYSFATKLNLHSRPGADSTSPTPNLPQELAGNENAPTPDETRPEVTPTLVSAPALNVLPGPGQAVTNQPPRLEDLIGAPVVTSQLPDSADDQSNAPQQPTTSYGMIRRQFNVDAFVNVPPLGALARTNRFGQPNVRMQPAPFQNQPPGAPPFSPARQIVRNRATPTSAAKP